MLFLIRKGGNEMKRKLIGIVVVGKVITINKTFKKKKQRILKAILYKEQGDESSILLLQYQKKKQFLATKFY